MSWVIFQVSSMILTSINSIVDKRLVRDYQPTPFTYLGTFAIVGLPVAAAGVWIVPWIGIEAAVLGLLSGLFFSGAVMLYYQAMRFEDVSRLIPVLKISGILKLLLLATLLDDRLTWPQYTAFIAMLGGAFALAWKAGRNQASFRARLKLNRGIALMGVVAFLLACAGLLDSHLNLSYSPWIAVVWSQAGTVLGFCLLLLFPSRRAELRCGFRAMPPALHWTIIGQQALRLLISVLSEIAVSQAGSAAITAVLGGIRPVVILVMAVIFLGERPDRREAFPKLAGVGLMGIGTGLMLWN